MKIRVFAVVSLLIDACICKEFQNEHKASCISAFRTFYAVFYSHMHVGLSEKSGRNSDENQPWYLVLLTPLRVEVLLID